MAAYGFRDSPGKKVERSGAYPAPKKEYWASACIRKIKSPPKRAKYICIFAGALCGKERRSSALYFIQKGDGSLFYICIMHAYGAPEERIMICSAEYVHKLPGSACTGKLRRTEHKFMRPASGFFLTYYW